MIATLQNIGSNKFTMKIHSSNHILNKKVKFKPTGSKSLSLNFALNLSQFVLTIIDHIQSQHITNCHVTQVLFDGVNGVYTLLKLHHNPKPNKIVSRVSS